jgi:hypothetical protein
VKQRRYAEGTTVEAHQTKADIEGLVTRHGATGFLSAWADEDGRKASLVQFRLRDRMLKYKVTFPTPAEIGAPHGRLRNGAPLAPALEAEWRRRWRALFLIVKAKLEIVASGDSTFDREFLADIMLPDGSTVGETALPGVEHAYASGQMPRLLPGGPA